MQTTPVQTVETLIAHETPNAMIGASPLDPVGFYGNQPITQPTSSAFLPLTPSAPTSGGYGFATSAEFAAAQNQLIALNALLVSLGIVASS